MEHSFVLWTIKAKHTIVIQKIQWRLLVQVCSLLWAPKTSRQYIHMIKQNFQGVANLLAKMRETESKVGKVANGAKPWEDPSEDLLWGHLQRSPQRAANLCRNGYGQLCICETDDCTQATDCIRATSHFVDLPTTFAPLWCPKSFLWPSRSLAFYIYQRRACTRVMLPQV